MHDERELKFYDFYGKARPTSEAHGSVEDIVERLVPAKPRQWRQEGNTIITDTEIGPLTHFIPVDMTLQGTDDDGMPILAKITIQ